MEASSWVGGGEVMESETGNRGPQGRESSGKWESSAGVARRHRRKRAKIGKGMKAEAVGKVWGRNTDDEEGQTRMDITRGILMWKAFVT